MQMKERVKELLKQLVMQTDYSNVATMPIPVYEQTKQLIKDLYAENQKQDEQLKGMACDSYGYILRIKELESAKEEIAAHISEVNIRKIGLSQENQAKDAEIRASNKGAETNAKAMQIFLKENESLKAEIVRLREALQNIAHYDCVDLIGRNEVIIKFNKMAEQALAKE